MIGQWPLDLGPEMLQNIAVSLKLLANLNKG
jgi:hypothetical protein